MVRRSQFAALALVAGLAAPAAGAAVTVIGSGPEQDCYLAAKSQSANRGGLEACDLALTESLLNRRDRAATYVNRSVVLLTLERTRDALEDADAALAISPDLPAAAINRSAALIRLERFAEARATLDRALPNASGRELISALFNRAMASEAQGDVKSAYADLRRAIELDPEFETAKIELARYQVRDKR